MARAVIGPPDEKAIDATDASIDAIDLQLIHCIHHRTDWRACEVSYLSIWSWHAEARELTEERQMTIAIQIPNTDGPIMTMKNKRQ